MLFGITFFAPLNITSNATTTAVSKGRGVLHAVVINTLEFLKGLTIVTATGTAADVTILYHFS